MGVDPANHFAHEIREIGPDYGDDGEERGGQFLRRLCDSADGCAGLMDGAEASLGRTAVASLAARAEIEAGALIGIARRNAGDGGGRNSEIIGIIALFLDRPDAEFAA